MRTGALRGLLYARAPAPDALIFLSYGARVTSSFFRPTANVDDIVRSDDQVRRCPDGLTDACLVRMTEILSDPILLTTDSDFPHLPPARPSGRPMRDAALTLRVSGCLPPSAGIASPARGPERRSPQSRRAGARRKGRRWWGCPRQASKHPKWDHHCCTDIILRRVMKFLSEIVHEIAETHTRSPVRLPVLRVGVNFCLAPQRLSAIKHGSCRARFIGTGRSRDPKQNLTQHAKLSPMSSCNARLPTTTLPRLAQSVRRSRKAHLPMQRSVARGRTPSWRGALSIASC